MKCQLCAMTLLNTALLVLGSAIEASQINDSIVSGNTTDEDILCSKMNPLSNWYLKMEDNITYSPVGLPGLEETKMSMGKEQGWKERRRGRRRMSKAVGLKVRRSSSGLDLSETEYKVQITNHLSHEVKALLLFQPLNYSCGAGILEVNTSGRCFIKSEMNLQSTMSKLFTYVLPECGVCVNVSVHYAHGMNNETHIIKPNNLNKLQRLICEHSDAPKHSISSRKSGMRRNKFRRHRMGKHHKRHNRFNRRRNRFWNKHRREKKVEDNDKINRRTGRIKMRKRLGEDEEPIFKEKECEFNDLNKWDEDEAYDGSGEEDYSAESDESSEEESSEEDEMSDESEEDSSEEHEESDESEEDSSEEHEECDESEEEEYEGSGEEEASEEKEGSVEKEEDYEELEGEEENIGEEDQGNENEDMTEGESEENEITDNEEQSEGSGAIEERRIFPLFKKRQKKFRNNMHKSKKWKHMHGRGKELHFRVYRICCREGIKHKLNIGPSDEKCKDIPEEVKTWATENFSANAEFCIKNFTSCCKERKSQHGHPILSVISLMHHNRHRKKVNLE